MTNEQAAIRQSNGVVYAIAIGTVAVSATFVALGVGAYNAWMSVPEAGRLVFMGTCGTMGIFGVMVAAAVSANNLTRGIAQRIAQPAQQYAQPEIVATQYRELPPVAPMLHLQPPAQRVQQAMQQANQLPQHLRAIPINTPNRRPPPPPTPRTITTNGYQVEVEKLRKMLAAETPTRDAVQQAGAGIDNNSFATYRQFLILHHMIDATQKPAKWANSAQNQFVRDEWLDGILGNSPTAIEQYNEEY